MNEGGQLGRNVVGDFVQPRTRIEVEILGQSAPETRRLARRETAIAVERKPVATAPEAELAAATVPAMQIGFDHDSGANLEGKGRVGAGDPSHHLMTQH